MIKNIETYQLRNYSILVSKINGNQIGLSEEQLNRKDIDVILNKNKMYERIKFSKEYDKNQIKTVFISLHSSSKCNLKCKYCFMKERIHTTLTIEDAKKFIDMIIAEFPNAEKYIVDPTGSGEPLLNIDLILKIGLYCKEKSDEVKKEVLPMLVTNGTLLDEDKVNTLRDAGILFGISIDGDKKSHDANRISYSGEGTYKKIISNFKKIKNKSLIGAAVTLNNDNKDLLKTFKHLYRYFPTISIKPVRSFNKDGGIDETNIQEIKKEYTKLFDFILSKTLKGNLDYISVLLNGDDYFGKFLLRVILDQKVSTRCDAGSGRFSLSSDGKIYACPGAINIKDLEIGSIDQGLIKDKMDYLWNVQINRDKCHDCEAKFVCGGECMVVSYYANNRIDDRDEIMCELKRHLFKLAVIFKFEVYRASEELFKILYDGCVKKINRFSEDMELKKVLMRTNGKYSFTELKKIKDHDYDLFKKIDNES